MRSPAPAVVVFFLLTAGGLAVPAQAQDPPSTAATAAECPVPACTPVQRESGWFEEKGGECVPDMATALRDLKAHLAEKQKLLAGKTTDDFLAEVEASQARAARLMDDGTGGFDICIGPAILDGACGIQCSDCMCCVFCWGHHHCWLREVGNSFSVNPVVVRE